MIDKSIEVFETYLGGNGEDSEKSIKNKKRSSFLVFKALSKYSIIYGYCLFLSVIFLLVCTKSSPLYPFNDWEDSNSFFTMGKGMMNGKVLYRDLFEQKGPLLYFIHGIAYLISNKTFFGVFIFEVISFSIFLLYNHKLFMLFLDIKYSIISLPIISAIILNMRNFTHGDSAEEFCLPLMAISLYYLIDYFKNIYPKPASSKVLLLNGIIAGCVLWIKFTLLGFWFGWMASMFFCMIANKIKQNTDSNINKNYLRAIKGCFVFLFGMLFATIPWFIYFGINHSIMQWIDTYVLVNVRSYPNRMSIIERIKYVLLNIYKNITLNWIFGFFFCLGVLIFIVSKKFIKSRLNRICFFFCLLFLALGVYGGGRAYIYYFLIFSPFVIFGFIVILDLFSMKFDKRISLNKSIVIAMITLLILLPLTLHYNHNAYMLKINKGDLVQFKFASIINQTENATLLNYGSLDAGFYTVTGIIPNIRFFQKQNIDHSLFPLNMDEQNRYIKNRKVEYVVIRERALNNNEMYYIPYLYEYYQPIAQGTQIYEKNTYNYFLFKIK